MGGAKARTPEYGGIQLKWALIFFLISIVAGLFGFTGLARGSATIAKVLFFLFLVIFIIVLILAITAGEIIL